MKIFNECFNGVILDTIQFYVIIYKIVLFKLEETKSDYDCPEYRTLCRNLFLPFVDDIKAYISNGYEIVGILGIKHSPTCSVRGRQGIFIEEINSLLKSNDITLKSYDIPESYNEDSESLELYHEIKSAFNL